MRSLISRAFKAAYPCLANRSTPDNSWKRSTASSMIDLMAPSHLSFVLTSAGLALGLVAQLGGWAAAIAVALLPLAYTVLRSLISGKAGVDFSQQGRDAAGW